MSPPSDPPAADEVRLDYAPPPPWHRKRRLRRYVLLSLLVAGGGCLAYQRKPLVEQARLLYWQRQCLAYSAPADQVVYEEDPGQAAVLLARAGYGDAHAAPGPTASPAFPTPPPPVAGHAPPCLAPWWGAWGLPGNAGLPVLFLHERTSKGGVRRLVLVQRRPQDCQPLYAPFELDTTLYNPAPWNGRPATIPPTPNRMMPLDMPLSLLPPARLRFYAGQPDPADPAHFTICYEMDTDEKDGGKGRGAGAIDGRLRDDGRSVHFTVRDGPGALPSLWAKPAVPDP